jgi:hypothetical protein
MTYEESYRKLNSFEELKKEVANDMAMALLTNTDRLPIIRRAAEKITIEKFNMKLN